MTKIVYNACYGGFGLSPEGEKLLAEKKGWEMDGNIWAKVYDISRTDPALVAVVEELGEKAGGNCANLQIAERYPGEQYHIHEYDGYESVRSPSDYNWSIA